MNKHAAAFASMLIGPILVFGLVLLMNHYASNVEKLTLTEPAQIQRVKKIKPKAKKKLKKAKPKPTRTRARRAPAPFKGLNSALSGIDMGLPGLMGDDMDAIDRGLLGKTAASVMTEDLVDVPPRAKVKSAFKYPASAKKKGIKGYVVLSVLIGRHGDVEQVQVLESNPAGVFDDVAITGIRSWRFEPAQYQGQAVKVWAKQRIRFELS